MKIAIFYHCLFYHGTPPQLVMNALHIVSEQVHQMRESGLIDACDEMVVGVNGGRESEVVARKILPDKARIVYHGLESKAENLTIVEIEKWAPSHPGWAILYLHCKGATHKPNTDYHGFSSNWRRGMMEDLVTNWRKCVSALEGGHDVACSHFMRGMGSDGSQNIAAGNFWWSTSNFVATLPSIYKRERIKVSGISSPESRFESEVWIGNGRMPKVMEFRPNGGGGVP
jgi:hypothetical protein